MTTTDQAKMASILKQAALAIEFVTSKVAGLPSCTCGQQQYTERGVYIAQDAVGGGFRDADPDVGEPITETACIMCACYCRAGGEIMPLAQLDMDFAGGNVSPQDPVDCAAADYEIERVR